MHCPGWAPVGIDPEVGTGYVPLTALRASDTLFTARLAAVFEGGSERVGLCYVDLDDFGTGYSNLAYLRRPPVCEPKIAETFMDGLRAPAGDPVDERIVETLVSLRRRSTSCWPIRL